MIVHLALKLGIGRSIKNKIKYFRESLPTQLKPGDVLLDDPNLADMHKS
jgi:hypothetical protein